MSSPDVLGAGGGEDALDAVQSEVPSQPVGELVQTLTGRVTACRVMHVRRYNGIDIRLFNVSRDTRNVGTRA